MIIAVSIVAVLYLIAGSAFAVFAVEFKAKDGGGQPPSGTGIILAAFWLPIALWLACYRFFKRLTQ